MSSSSVLILGAGLIARPIIRYLLEKDFKVTVASNTPDRSDAMIAGHHNGASVYWEATDETALTAMISSHNLIVSLLPPSFHVMVANHCIALKVDMLTASYVKPEMQALDAKAKEAGIIILNELGLDPGIDHMSAMRIIDHVHAKGGKIEEFYSICGALPAPEAADNPFRYKFSWSPKGVIMAGNNDGKFLKDGAEVYVPTCDLFKNPKQVDFPNIGLLEVYPNRDSISYIDIYGIPEVKTIQRGTFRFKGWCETMDAMKQLGLISSEVFDFEGKSYSDMMALLINESNSLDIRKKVAAHLGIEVNAYALNAMEWLGLFSEEDMNRKSDSPYEIVSDMMIAKMELGVNERDMVVMQHTFLATYPDGNQEVICSRMLDFGTLATDTSVARTVALPAAIGVEMILTGKIKMKGVYRPVLPEIYNPILDQLEKLNIKMEEEYGLPLSERIV